MHLLVYSERSRNLAFSNRVLASNCSNVSSTPASFILCLVGYKPERNRSVGTSRVVCPLPPQILVVLVDKLSRTNDTGPVHRCLCSAQTGNLCKSRFARQTRNSRFARQTWNHAMFVGALTRVDLKKKKTMKFLLKSNHMLK